MLATSLEPLSFLRAAVNFGSALFIENAERKQSR